MKVCHNDLNPLIPTSEGLFCLHCGGLETPRIATGAGLVASTAASTDPSRDYRSSAALESGVAPIWQARIE